eukprot:TRINITY_DN11870_c0_g2_i6.p2 TRINITY_DN11870_c0_g2~~TRINITY_DN11870_c0_g2_i6.p2  ORF type:complete len:246 (+),score=68.22 TRINITY_DN11870_c0_g2_i6:1979-2716(+)
MSNQLTEADIQDVLKRAEEVIKVNGGPGFHIALCGFKDGAQVHGSYAAAVMAAKKAFGQHHGVNPEEELVTLPPGVDAVAAVHLAVDACTTELTGTTEEPEQAAAEAAAKALKEFAPRAKASSIIAEHCVQVAKLTLAWKKEAEEYRINTEAKYADLCKAIKQREEEAKLALENDLAAGKRPDLRIVFDDGMLSAEPEQETDPWLKFEAYIERHQVCAMSRPSAYSQTPVTSHVASRLGGTAPSG